MAKEYYEQVCREYCDEHTYYGGHIIMKKTTSILILCMAFAACILTACGSKNSVGSSESAQENISQQENPESGDAASETSLSLKSFEAKTLDGETFTQEDIAAKEVTLINFWTTTCPPCIAEMPDISEFAESLPDNIQVVTVCLDGEYNPESAREILEEASYEGITLISGDGDFQDVCGAIMYTPTTIFVAQDGRVWDYAIIGGQESLTETYTAAVDEFLKSTREAETQDE